MAIPTYSSSTNMVSLKLLHTQIACIFLGLVEICINPWLIFRGSSRVSSFSSPFNNDNRNNSVGFPTKTCIYSICSYERVTGDEEVDDGNILDELNPYDERWGVAIIVKFDVF